MSRGGGQRRRKSSEEAKFTFSMLLERKARAAFGMSKFDISVSSGGTI